MTEETASSIVARLDRNKPPPGYEVYGAFDGGWWFSPVGFEPDVGDDGFALYDFAKAAAWEHYEARHNPPIWDEEEWMQAVDALGREQARAAAWAWYWRRAALSLVMEVSGIEAYRSAWPACLAWPDETVAHHEAAMRLLGNINDELRTMMDFRGIVPWRA